MTAQTTFNSEGGIIPPPAPPEANAKISLPGHGAPGNDCQQEIHMHCNHCGHTWIGTKSCMLRTCPHCWRKWAAKEARAAGLRMFGGVSMIAPRRTGRRIVHAVISFATTGELRTDRRQAMKLLKAHGISGGLIIYHPYRQDDDGKYIPQEHIHFHAIGLARGSIPPGASSQYFFKVILDAQNKDYRGFQSLTGLKACIFYLLTHCGIQRGHHAVTWFGELSYNALSNEKLFVAIPEIKAELEKEYPRRCPSCGSDDTEPDFIFDYLERDFIDCRHRNRDTIEIRI